MEAEVFHLGNWKNIKEMEDTLTLDEVYLLREALFKAEHRRNKFAAALKGVDLDAEINSGQSDAFEEAKRKAEATLAGKSEEEVTYSMLGIAYEAD